MKSLENKNVTKGIYTGSIEKDAKGNYYCGEYLLDYKYTERNFKQGDRITIRSVIVNPSDISFKDYPKKSKNFVMID